METGVRLGRWVMSVALAGLMATAGGLRVLAGEKTPQTITVSAAISLKEVLEALGRAYQQQTGDQVRLNFGASGQLEAQIRHGAPVDLFISAAEAQVDVLIKAGLADADTRQVVARNRLVLIVPPDAKNPPRSFAELVGAGVKRLAIGQPRTVPAGEYASQILDKLHLTQSLQGRLVYGANVRQVLAYVERGEVDAGIVYASDAAYAGSKVRVVAEAQAAWHAPIVYPAVVIRASGHRAAAQRFEQFLRTPAAGKILAAAGFAAAGTGEGHVTTAPVPAGEESAVHKRQPATRPRSARTDEGP